MSFFCSRILFWTPHCICCNLLFNFILILLILTSYLWLCYLSHCFELLSLPLCCFGDKAASTFFLYKFILFIYFWPRWVFVAVCGLSLVATSGGYSSLRCAGFSLWWLLLLRSTGSRSAGFSSCGSQALERRLTSCGAWA